jgi:tRNA pseudouridine55 synthase
MRNTSRERSVGHTGTLDPRATGLLPLVMGKATRLAPYLAGSDKTYDATIQFGSETDTDDGGGTVTQELGSHGPGEIQIIAALQQFTGTFEQVPPIVSAKRVDGQKSYDLARQNKAVELKPVSVTVHEIQLTSVRGSLACITVTATAGFYVRALARDLGRVLGCGAHLAALRRTRSGTFDISQAIPFEDAERLGPGIETRLISPADALGYFPAVTVNELGLKRVVHGNPLNPGHLKHHAVPTTGSGEKVRILDEDGALIALADSRGGALHPSVVIV